MRTASATASLTESVGSPAADASGPIPGRAGPDGATLNATITGPECQVASAPRPGSARFGSLMATAAPLPFDPIERAASLWSQRIGPSSTMAAVTSVMRVQQILQYAVDSALRPLGLTFARYEALVLLRFARDGALPMSKMGQRLQLHPTSITNIVDRLERSELVRRRPHPTDGRTTLVEITDGGRALGERATTAVTAVDFGLVGLDDAEVATLTALLARVRHAAGDFT